jgi:hypothetical protein
VRYWRSLSPAIYGQITVDDLIIARYNAGA